MWLLKGFAAVLATACVSLVARPAGAACQLQELAQYPLKMVGNQPLVQVSINGQPEWFLFDTGSNSTIIFRRDAIKLGLALKRMDGAESFGVGGSDIIDEANIRELKIGNAVAHDMDVLVTSNGGVGRDYIGLIGQNLFAEGDLELDFADSIIKLFRPKGCVGDQVVYWGKAYSVAPIASSASLGQLPVTVTLDGQSGTALLDTGAGYSVVTTAFAARVGVRPGEAGVSEAGSSHGLGAVALKNWIATFPSFGIGEEVIKNARLNVSDLWSQDTYVPGKSRLSERVDIGSDMLLGADFIRAHRLYIARSQGKIYFSYNGGPIFRLRSGASQAPAATSSPQPAPAKP
jgi:predicted aspartyl protease